MSLSGPYLPGRSGVGMPTYSGETGLPLHDQIVLLRQYDLIMFMFLVK